MGHQHGAGDAPHAADTSDASDAPDAPDALDGSGAPDGSRERLLQAWFDDLPLLVDRLEQVHLPDGVPADYSPASLAALERALLDEPGGPDEDFVRAAAGYLGEVLMDACGGGWDVDPGAGPPSAPGRGEPVVRPDPVLGLDPLSPAVLIEVALAEDSGEVLTRELEQLLDAVGAVSAGDPDWQPHRAPSPLDPLGPQPPDPWLTSWLRDRRAAFPLWAEQTGEPSSKDGGWDFSPASLDLLERQVRARYAGPADVDADAVRQDPFLAGAVWYLGQVLCLRYDSAWLHWDEDPGAEPGSHHHPDNPWSGIPFTGQPRKRRSFAVDPLAELRNLVRYGAGYRLREILRSVH
jgi:hypothetical protein